MTRKPAATLLSAAALVLLAASGATPALLVPLGLAALAAKHVLIDRAGREFPQGLQQVLHTLLCTALLVGAFLSLFSRTELSLVYLLSFGVPFLVLRNLATSTPFNDFFIFLVSVLLVVGAAALAGDGAILITAAYIVVGSLVLPNMAIRDGPRDETTRLHVERSASVWKNAPLLTKLALAGVGFLCGAFLYLLAPRVPPDTALADEGDLGLTE
ncbi:MAG: transglutaminaseTgpA domain-containing protein, partial [Planctomycetota bacterium]|nr:transglutaminaseTgpA domain-containing protein [Planctomycetota bacterium]